MPSESIRYARSADGTQIAWAESGSGPRTLVWAANFITDIRNDWEIPDLASTLRRLGEHFRVIRSDHRGCGSSQRNVERHDQAAWVEDLEAVMRAARVDQPCILWAPSGASPYAAVFAAEHPERVSHLALYGSYVCGALASGNPDLMAHWNAIMELVRVGWGSPDPAARMLVLNMILPGALPEDLPWAERLPQTANRDDALRYMRAAGEQDAREHLGRIRVPTLVSAMAGDKIILPEWTRMVAAAIPGAEYLELPGSNHIPIDRDPSFDQYLEHFMAFVSRPPADDPLAELSARERDILDGLRAGLSNEAIALQRDISVKTVRNHLTRIFDKLRVNSRTQAVLVATGRQ